MEKITMPYMKKVMDNADIVLEHLYIISIPTLKAVSGCIESIKTLTDELNKEMQGKSIDEDENLQGMILQYAKACSDCEEVFKNALYVCEITGLELEATQK